MIDYAETIIALQTGRNKLTDLLTTDPAIKAGRLIFEIYPWYTAPIGSFSPGKPLKN